jgi:outer membrane protein OmpA-like peptidoglycan-associated protein
MRWSLGSLAALLALGSAASAVAQSPYRLDVQHLHPTAMPGSGLGVEGGEGLPAWAFSAATSFNFAYRALRAEEPGGVVQAILLEHQSVLEPAFALGLPLGFALELSWPFALTGQDTLDAREITLWTLRGVGIGDPRVGLSWRLRATEGLLVLADVRVTIPTLGAGDGAWAELASEPGASVLGRLGAEGRIEIVRLRANVGVRGRTEDASIGSAFRVGSELTFGAALEVAPLRELQVLTEVYGSSTFEPFFARDTTPLEAIVGARVLPIPSLELLAFGGIGLSEGYGTPAGRAGLTVRFYPHTPDADGDGVGDDADRCAGELEDRDGHEDDDGCVDLDDDGDGIPDASDRCRTVAGLGRFGGCPDPDGDQDGLEGAADRCPEQAEDQDHFEDEDGCPEPDNDRDSVADADDRCPRDAEDRDGFQDEDGCPEPDNDRDGMPDADDRCPRDTEDRDGFEDEDGCADADNDGDGVADAEDGPPDPGGHFGVCRNLPETAGGRDAELPDGCPDSLVTVDVAARRIRVPPVYFDTDADVIQERSFADLQYVAEVLEANAWIRVLRVEGHTDDRGTDEHNLDLSRRRAASVVRFLVDRGVDPGRLASEGFGRAQPPTAEDDASCQRPTSSACRQVARRVVFRIAEIAADDDAP